MEINMFSFGKIIDAEEIKVSIAKKKFFKKLKSLTTMIT